MIYLQLFWTFFQIGLFTIGGGYAMIPMIRQQVVGNGWLTYEEIVNFMAVAESTPGPFAVNMATYVGFSQGGILGGVVATFAVVLPSFVIVLLVAKAYEKFRTNRFVQGALWGVRPVVVGLISSAALTILLGLAAPAFMFQQWNFEAFAQTDWISLGLFLVLLVVSQIKIKGKSLHPILLIVCSAAVGVLLFGVLKL